jgi:hypothetical protein
VYVNLLVHIIGDHAGVNILGRIVHTVKKNTEVLVAASDEIGLDVNDKKNEVHGHVLRSKCRTKSQYKY